MSRYSDYDEDEDFPGQFELYEANLRRAMRGKRGRKFLADLREALMALPEHRLIEGALCTVGAAQRRAEMVAKADEDWRTTREEWRPQHPEYWDIEDFDRTVERQGEGVCAIGALLWHQKVKAGEDPAAAFTSLPLVLGSEDGGLYETASLARKATGVAGMVAWQVAYKNDEDFDRCTPEQRHAKFIEWIDQQLAVTP